jgi:hypothetical protein
LDFVAKRYGVLPSKLIESGDSIDLQIASFASEYELWMAKNAKDGKKHVNHNLSQDQMLAMLNEVRNKQNG